MSVISRIRSWWDSVLSIGADTTESDSSRGKRRIVVGYFVLGGASRLYAAAAQFSEGSPVAWVDVVASVAGLVLLAVLWRKPAWFYGIVNVALLGVLIEVLAATVMLGGFVPSDVIILFGILSVIGALIVLRLRDAVLWAIAFAVTVILGAVLPSVVEPLEAVEGTDGGIAATMIGVTTFLFLGMAYFVRQRNRFQAQSDDLLHNILPEEIARRLKADSGMIADDYEHASVLFADVVDFTPMSARLSPPELVGLLNSVFTTFDGFVEELGLEKIKTVGDAYMVASGVPRPRPDHAHAIADLALRIRDHTARHTFEGHTLSMRIGINSGPVVAGIVGTHKFAYDLWGDVVNTASRMEAGGIPGAIQMTPATHELIRDAFECEPRGVITVKGKGEMHTYLLVGRRSHVE
ncbi:MAG: adenylate/guanylate cyclase domain-containing protein [Acidimicrobiia bacterium]